MLVLESQIKDLCHVFLNHKDLLILLSIEWSIYQAIVRKNIIEHPMVNQQHFFLDSELCELLVLT